MAFINLFIGRETKFFIKNNQIVINDDYSVPVEDINCLMIDNEMSTLTVYAINSLIEKGATIIFCDGKHLPFSLVLPFSGYYKRLNTLNFQRDFSKSKEKILWKEIIKRKIENQSHCLEFYNKKESKLLLNLSSKVKNFDSENVEAESARLYFPALFGEGFSREEDCFINSALNYGYSIIRSLIARQLSARGFECAYGIFHHNLYNAFNLVDDIIEPYRPMVDALVFNLEENIFSPSTKKTLFSVLDIDVLISNKRFAFSKAVEITCESFLAVIRGEKSSMDLPIFDGISQHEYE